ncbi:Bone morphoproteintic protein 1 [Sparganum proliferum]
MLFTLVILSVRVTTSAANTHVLRENHQAIDSEDIIMRSPQQANDMSRVAEGRHRDTVNPPDSEIVGLAQNRNPDAPSLSLSETAYVQILTDGIEPEQLHNFEKKKPYEIDSLGEPYDYDSIMHYHSAAFAKPNVNETIRPTAINPRPEIGQRIKPSVRDVRQANKLYNCPSCGKTFVASAGNFSSPQTDLFSSSEADNGRHGKPTGNARVSRNWAGRLSLKPKNTDPLYCRWRILADSGERILLFITQMDMLPPENIPQNDKQRPNNTHDCTKEYLEVRDGYYSGSPLIGRYCGTDLPPTLVSWSPRMLIEYIRPAGHSGSGFAAKYQIFCGGFMKADEGRFTSPGYPSNYPPSKICTWWIEVPAGFAIVLTFESIELEDQTDCPYDYLEIFDGSSDSSSALRRICGVQLPNPIWSTNNTMEVRFVTDYAVQKKGFVAKFRKVSYSEIDQCATSKHGCQHVCVTLPGGYRCQCYDGYKLLPDRKSCQLLACGGYLRRNKGGITSPGFPSQYPPNIKCVWTIEVAAGFSVVLTFDSFELEEQWDCEVDYLEVFDGSSESAASLRKICGSGFPKPVASTTNKMTLKFVSDGVISKKGFRVRFENVPYSKIDQCTISNHGCEHTCVNIAGGYKCQCHDGYYLLPDGKSCQSSACGEYMRSTRDKIASPGFPNEYPLNSKCVWKIQVPAGYHAVFTLEIFELEDMYGCPFDYLEVYDGPSESSSRLQKVCGSKIPAPFVSTTNVMTVKFVSDDLFNKKGFIGRCGKTTSFAASTQALNIDQHAKKRSEEKVHTSGLNVHVEKIGLNPAAAASSTKSTNSIGYAMEREVEDRSANASYLSQLKYGLYHEQSRPDRDVYLEIITENIKPENLHNFDKKDKDEINSLNETYDYDSVMHYSSTTFVKSGANETMRPIAFGPLPKIGHKVRPSEGDARQVNKLYKCPSIGCGGYLKSENGDFSSPEFPDWYPPNSKCVYNIEVSLGFSIVLTFESFEISEFAKLSAATVMHSGLLILFSLSAVFEVNTHVSDTIQLLSDSSKGKMALLTSNLPHQTADQFLVAEHNPQDPIITIDSGAQNEVENRQIQTMPKTGTTAEQELQTTSQNTLDTDGRVSEDAKQRSRRAVTSRKSHLWPSGIIPYEIEPLFSSSAMTIILTAMRTWENVTCVTFVEREPHHQSYLIFTVEKCGCCSNVGRQNEDRPQTISIAPSCESVRTVAHELGHAMGFWHEQSRPDRDAYVEILTENIKNDRLYNFEKKDQHEVDSLGEPYDYDSIMHYAKNLFAKPGATETLRPRECCPRPKIGHLSKPSAGDARQMNKLYSCPSCGQTFLDNSATFASPNAQTSLSSAEARDGRHKSGISTHALPFHGHAQSSPLQSTTSDPLFCRWRIIAASGERIQLTFTHMDMLPPTNLSQSGKQKPAHSSSCVNER